MIAGRFTTLRSNRRTLIATAFLISIDSHMASARSVAIDDAASPFANMPAQMIYERTQPERKMAALGVI